MSIQAYQLSGAGQASIPNPTISSIRSPTTTDIVSPAGNPYSIGQYWENTVSDLLFVYLGGGVWDQIASGSGGPIDTLTGNSGGAISPTAGNINILGSNTTTVVGSGSTLTITPTAGGYPITKYVVGPAGQAGYQTIQSAITAAATEALGGVVYVKPGTYTENLIFPVGAKTQIVGAVGQEDLGNIILIGQHTVPATGSIAVRGFQLQSTGDTFVGAAAGAGEITILESTFNITGTGWTFNLPNWTGPININNCGDISVTNGVLNNAGGVSLYANNCQIGAGTTKTFTSNGGFKFDLCYCVCPVSVSAGTIIGLLSVFGNTLTLSGATTGSLWLADFITGANAALVMSSSAAVSITNSTITSSNNPAIAGSGAGVLTLGGVDFTSNTSTAGTLTLGTADVFKAGALQSLSTVTAATGLTVTAGGAAITGTTTINTSGSAVTSIGTGGTGATNIGNATGNTAVTGSLTASTGLVATTGGITATGTSNINTSGAAVTSIGTGGTGATNIGNATGNTAVTGSLTASTGLVATTGGITATGTSNINTSGAAVTSIGTGGTGATNIGNATGNTAVTGSLTASTTLTATAGAITATNGNFVASTAGTGVSLPIATGSGAAGGTVTCNGRQGAVTFTGPSIAAGAVQTLTMGNTAITGSGTVIIYSLVGVTTGAALTIQSVTNSAGQSAVVVANGAAVTTSTASITLNFIVLN